MTAPAESDVASPASGDILDLTARRMTSRTAFMPIYMEGFGILEDAASYLAERAPLETKLMTRPECLAYTLESCKLTTAAIRLAAWMMMQRAVVEREVTAARVAADPNRPRIDGMDLPDRERLPEGLRPVVERLASLTARLQSLDRAFYGRLAAV